MKKLSRYRKVHKKAGCRFEVPEKYLHKKKSTPWEGLPRLDNSDKKDLAYRFKQETVVEPLDTCELTASKVEYSAHKQQFKGND